MNEDSMGGLLSQRLEQGIQSIREGISKKGGTKKLNKVYERIGRLKQKYPSAHTSYGITVSDDGNGTATGISCRHKTDEASMAHLNLAVLAYWLVATIRYQLKQKGMNSDWREIVRKMNTQKCVTTSLVNIKQETISIRQCTEPTKEAKAIYDILN